jgi:hypothetical protein
LAFAFALTFTFAFTFVAPHTAVTVAGRAEPLVPPALGVLAEELLDGGDLVGRQIAALQHTNIHGLAVLTARGRLGALGTVRFAFSFAFAFAFGAVVLCLGTL